MSNVKETNQIDQINQLNKIPPVHTLIDNGISNSKTAGDTLHDMAARCGLLRSAESKAASPAMSMLRVGKMRLPMDKIITVADELKIDRRKLFVSQIRESLHSLIVKKNPKEEIKEYNRVWRDVSSILVNMHSERENYFVQAMRDIEEEIGQEITPDEVTIEQFKNMLRDQYSL